MSTRVTQWQITILYVATHGSEPRNSFFHLLDMTILSSYILLQFCGSKMMHTFRIALVKNLIKSAGTEVRPYPIL
jgi:hypothetical protein